MALDALKPIVYSKELMFERERDCVFKSLTFAPKGEIKKKGDVLYLPSMGDPTITSYVQGTDLDLESLVTTNQQLHITQAEYFNFEIDDVDDAQSMIKVNAPAIRRAKQKMAQNMDVFIAGKYTDAGSTVDATVTVSNILSTILEAQQNLYENDVPPSATIYLVVSPKVLTKMQKAKIIYSTDNAAMFKGKAGIQGGFMNFAVFMSNSVVVDTDSVHHCMAFTGDTIALGEQIQPGSAEVYRPQKSFSTAFKALNLYGATVARPKELVDIQCTIGDDAEVL